MTQCIKVKELRKIGCPSLREWLANPNNLYVGRHGRIFITDPITIKELEGKTLGCFCDQKGECHGKVLVRLLGINIKK